MSKQPRSLHGKVIAITGGARGIGKATAEALSRAGAVVAIGDLDADLAAEAAAGLSGNAIGLALDVTDRVGFSAFLDEVETQLGPLYGLVNNAGIMPTGNIDLEDDATTTREIAINLHAVIHGTKELIRRAKPRRSGHVINISSAAGKISGAGVATYTATKFAVVGFSESVALELDATGVDITVIYPALTKTELISGLKELRGVPQIEPSDVADAIVRSFQNPRFNVPVPRAMGAVMTAYQATPWPVRAKAAKVVKSDSVISEADQSARAAYEARVARDVAANRE